MPFHVELRKHQSPPGRHDGLKGLGWQCPQLSSQALPAFRNLPMSRHTSRHSRHLPTSPRAPSWSDDPTRLAWTLPPPRGYDTPPSASWKYPRPWRVRCLKVTPSLALGEANWNFFKCAVLSAKHSWLITLHWLPDSGRVSCTDPQWAGVGPASTACPAL